MNEKNIHTAAFYTLGCKVNQYETDAMNELFDSAGYRIVDFSEPADVYVINTCTVTNMADRKSRQILHRAKKKNPGSVIVAAGCYVQAAGEELLQDGMIDLIVGNNQKKDIVQIVEAYMREKAGKQETDVSSVSNSYLIDINQPQEYECLSISHMSEHTRAYIKIQDGCNQFCSYCIIPFARGRVRSRSLEDILDEVRRLAKNHYKEIVLTGIHISSYGFDFDGENYNSNAANGHHLLDLIRHIAQIPGIERIRLGSLEPRIITDGFAEAISKIPQVCPHFHLSLQSGCNETLKRMNRHYTAEDYREGCRILRKWYDQPAITTDVIVGFPGETEEEFEECRSFLEEIGFAQMHIFKYSKRKGTKAAEMKQQISEAVKTERSNVLLALDEKLQEKYKAMWRNRPMEVLLEEEIEIHGKKYMTGHSREYIRVAVPAEDGGANDMISVCATDDKYEEMMICKRFD